MKACSSSRRHVRQAGPGRDWQSNPSGSSRANMHMMLIANAGRVHHPIISTSPHGKGNNTPRCARLAAFPSATAKLALGILACATVVSIGVFIAGVPRPSRHRNIGRLQGKRLVRGLSFSPNFERPPRITLASIQ